MVNEFRLKGGILIFIFYLGSVVMWVCLTSLQVIGLYVVDNLENNHITHTRHPARCLSSPARLASLVHFPSPQINCRWKPNAPTPNSIVSLFSPVGARNHRPTGSAGALTASDSSGSGNSSSVIQIKGNGSASPYFALEGVPEEPMSFSISSSGRSSPEPLPRQPLIAAVASEPISRWVDGKPGESEGSASVKCGSGAGSGSGVRRGAENGPSCAAPKNLGNERDRDECFGSENRDPAMIVGHRRGRQQRSQSVGSAHAVVSSAPGAVAGSFPGSLTNGPGGALRTGPESSRSFSIGCSIGHSLGHRGGGNAGDVAMTSLASESVMPVPVVLPPLLATALMSRATSDTAPASEPQSPGITGRPCDDLVMPPLPGIMDHQEQPKDQQREARDGDAGVAAGPENVDLLSDHRSAANYPVADPGAAVTPAPAPIFREGAAVATAATAMVAEEETTLHQNVSGGRKSPAATFFDIPDSASNHHFPQEGMPSSAGSDGRRTGLATGRGDNINPNLEIVGRAEGGEGETVGMLQTESTEKRETGPPTKGNEEVGEGLAAEPAFRRPEYVVKMCLTLYKVNLVFRGKLNSLAQGTQGIFAYSSYREYKRAIRFDAQP